MTDFERNDPLGIVTEGLLQKQDPISAAAAGVIKKKKYTYIAKIDAFTEASSLLQYVVSYNGDSTITSISDAGISVTFDINSTQVHADTSSLAIDEFIPSSTPQEERGGRGAYTKRKKTVQPHVYIWNVPIALDATPRVSAYSDVEFIKHKKFKLILDLPKTTVTQVVYDVEPEAVTFDYVSQIEPLFTSLSSEHAASFHRDVVKRQDEDIIAMLLMDEQSIPVFATVYDTYGDTQRRKDEDLLMAMGVL